MRARSEPAKLATFSDTNVSSGGALVVSAGGSADPTAIFSGASETISAGGVDSGAQISGGVELVFGQLNGATIFTGSQAVEAGGTGSGTTIGGGTAVVLSGGRLDSSVVQSPERTFGRALNHSCPSCPSRVLALSGNDALSVPWGGS